MHAFRAAGMPVLWTNWGVTDFDSEYNVFVLFAAVYKVLTHLQSYQYAPIVHQRLFVRWNVFDIVWERDGDGSCTSI